MHIQVVTFGLNGIDESEYLDAANDVAPRFAGRPGLLAKIWLEDPEQGRYGAIYFWEDRESMERLVHSDLFEAANPEFSDVASEGFTILENLTAQTQPVLEVVPTRQPPAPRRQPLKPVPQRQASARGFPKKLSGAAEVPTGGARKIPISSRAAPIGPAAKKAATKAAPAKKSATKKAPAKKSAAGRAGTKAAKKSS